MLELMGLAFMVILFCVFAGGAFGAVWMRGQFQETSVLGVLQKSLENVEPAEVEKAPDAEWYHPMEAEYLCDEYRQLQTTEIGRYCIADIDNICLHGFVMSNPPAFITVNDHPTYGCWTDIVMLPENGGSLTLTTVASPDTNSVRPDLHRLERLHVSTHPESLRGYAKSCLLNENFLDAKAEEFVDILNLIMAECQNALVEQDIDQSLLESMVEDSGIVLQGDEAETINADRQVKRHEDTLRQCMQTYASNSGLSAEEWEMHREEILVVYDRQPLSILLETLFERFDVSEELEVTLSELAAEDVSARHIASQFIAALPNGDSINRVSTLTLPVQADVYQISSQDAIYDQAA